MSDEFGEFLQKWNDSGWELEWWQRNLLDAWYLRDREHHVHFGGPVRGKSASADIWTETLLTAAVETELVGDDIRGTLHDGRVFIVAGGARRLLDSVINEAEGLLGPPGP